MENQKELNTNSYHKNSKYHRHTGPGVRHTQKSRSYKEDHNRDWRKRHQKKYHIEQRKNIKSQVKHQNFKVDDKLETKTKRINL